ncbi:UvrD/REP helicase N-terminal domain-containing protein [Sphingobium sp. YR657]|nr:UvrD/REP helicase N-terminal domain-containing protein [Sphingobium sp. YR657]
MVSFTRTAVAEIRARMHGHVGDAAFAIKVATLDAHAWTIHSGYDPSASLTGSHDENIDRVIALVTSDAEVAEYLQNVEHFVIDEAQDLVGSRADLIEAIIARLSPECGVTVFADEAQAIYGFSEDEDRKSRAAGAASLLDRLRTEPSYRFAGTALETIHRTSAQGLKRIFSEVRGTLLGSTGSGIFARIREAVSANADNCELQRTSLGLDTLSNGTLVLFRRRSEALEASQFCPAPHSLRLSGYGAHLPSWLAVSFHDWTTQYIGESTFLERWQERVEAGSLPDYGPQEAWIRLTRMAGTSDGSLDMHQLRRNLARRAAPVEIATAEFGLAGPVLGTIHASKGREADSVLLLMPDTEEFKSSEDEEEETRVLFVGSTRARASLRVGSASKWTGSSIESGRCYRTLSKKVKPAAMVEFGRPEDLGIEGLVGNAHQGASDAAMAQRWLTKRAGVISQFDLVRDAAQDWNFRLVIPGDNLSVGLTSPRLRQDLWEVANVLGKGTQPPNRVPYLRALGSRSLVFAPDDPIAERLHAPWRDSGFVVAPRLAAFTRVGFWRKG